MDSIIIQAAYGSGDPDVAVLLGIGMLLAFCAGFTTYLILDLRQEIRHEARRYGGALQDDPDRR